MSECRPRPSREHMLSLKESTVVNKCVWCRCVCAVLQVLRIQAGVWGTTEARLTEFQQVLAYTCM